MQPKPHPGLISAHFHFGNDGRKVLNYAERTNEPAHRELMESPITSEKRRIIATFPGYGPFGFRRYRFPQSRTVHPA